MLRVEGHAVFVVVIEGVVEVREVLDVKVVVLLIWFWFAKKKKRTRKVSFLFLLFCLSLFLFSFSLPLSLRQHPCLLGGLPFGSRACRVSISVSARCSAARGPLWPSKTANTLQCDDSGFTACAFDRPEGPSRKGGKSCPWEATSGRSEELERALPEREEFLLFLPSGQGT